ncbi:MAG: molybdenum cofactor guanylyltransferase [Gammaproteobacteria bacterium]|nr:molybdenum cofactor guanylyltransferase [Gammaproteobacteria bacterium]MCW8909185.1 molybdenum cofactor guanylyltransferase [Gammaproteobacteria bacterium]MCW9004383.1 molybdenum cofactor guanylyltransferase [Gammaproteobacteria bacterium]MCW9056680.1 molybdenum cofactor guanylyltransferase [Gammaproteobacteria bacterium]
MIKPENISTVILAGGLGRRMKNQDKGLIEWQGKSLIEHILSHISAQSGEIIINANRNLEHYAKLGFTLVSDEIDDYQGPLIGILSAMRSCSGDYLLCLPCDSPHPPSKLIERLSECLQSNKAASCALAHDGERLQPLFSLMSCSIQNKLENFLNEGNRKVHDFFLSLDPVICDFSDQSSRFRNFNTPDDLI